MPHANPTVAQPARETGSRIVAAAMTLVLVLALTSPGLAQQTQPPPPPPSKPQQPAPPEAGGPEGDTGPIILPKKKEEAPAPPVRPPKKPEGMPNYSLRVDVPLVTVPVLVTTKEGQFIPGLKGGNFRVLEDGVPQKIEKFEQSQAPITAALVVEFANTNYQFMVDALNAAYAFAQSLQPHDWVAVVAFDLKPRILVDFTQDKGAVLAALNQLRIPGFSDTDVFDALYDTLDRMAGLSGRSYIILISNGCDTFSKVTYDKVLKKIKETPDIGIFTISTGEVLRMWIDAHGPGSGPSPFACSTHMDFLQADNQMATFARMSGGRWYKPRFEGELPEIFHSIAADIRNQYLITYHPSNTKLDGTYRKIEVELVAPNGGPLRVQDQKGKQLKVKVMAREGYTAKHQVE
jgi:VWFA-related protein